MKNMVIICFLGYKDNSNGYPIRYLSKHVL